MRDLLRVLAALAWVALAGCATGTADRLQPSADPPVPLWLDSSGRPKHFDTYQANAQAHIEAHHPRAAETPPGGEASVAQLNAPHAWPRVADPACTLANTHGVLLVHGLTDSPYLMRDLGDALARSRLPNGRCLLVRSLLLPGHGTRPGDLLTVSLQDWLAATAWGVRSFAGDADKVHLVGFSTGGALGLLLSDQHRPRAAEVPAPYAAPPPALEPPLASLVLLAPAIRALDPLSRYPWLLRMLAGSGAMRWVETHEDRDWAKYESFALNGGAQIALLGRALDQQGGQRFAVPVFMAVSLNDNTIDSAESIERFLQGADDRSRLWLAAPDKSATQRPAIGAELADRRLKAFRAAVADPKRVKLLDATSADDVHDMAHTALPVREDNPHYGRGGRYVNCLAYSKALVGVMRACQSGTRAVVYGETPVPKDTSADPLVRRLTFNPLFDTMVQDIRAFLETVTLEKTP